MLHAIWLSFLHITGADDTAGTWYGFWSGFGSDLGEFAIITVVWHHLNCHESGCMRIGRHHVGSQVLCSKHFHGNMAA